MKMKSWPALSLLLAGLAVVVAASGGEELLQRADEARFLEAPSYELLVEAVKEGPEEERSEARLRVLSKRFPEGYRTRIEFLAPEALAGTVYLIVGEEIFFWKPGLSGPLRLGGRQRLFGTLSVIEAARLTLSGNYRVESEEQGPGGLKLTLQATKPRLVYPWITLHLGSQDLKPQKLVLQALSREPLKQLIYRRYGLVEGDELAVAFRVEDLLFAGHRTSIQVAEVAIRPLPDSLFDPQALGGEPP
jgi:hypothetical protein